MAHPSDIYETWRHEVRNRIALYGPSRRLDVALLVGANEYGWESTIIRGAVINDAPADYELVRCATRHRAVKIDWTVDPGRAQSAWRHRWWLAQAVVAGLCHQELREMTEDYIAIRSTETVEQYLDRIDTASRDAVLCAAMDSGKLDAKECLEAAEIVGVAL